MAIIYPTGGGAPGVDPTVLTATAGDVVAGELAGVKDNYDPVVGTLTLTGTAQTNNVLSGTTFYNTNPKVKLTGTIPSRAGQTINPTANIQTVSTSGQYLTGNIVVNGVTNLIPSNIKENVVVGGTTGTLKDYSYLAVGQTAF